MLATARSSGRSRPFEPARRPHGHDLPRQCPRARDHDQLPGRGADGEGSCVSVLKNAQHVCNLFASVLAGPAPADHDPPAYIGRCKPNFEPVAHGFHPVPVPGDPMPPRKDEHRPTSASHRRFSIWQVIILVFGEAWRRYLPVTHSRRSRCRRAAGPFLEAPTNEPSRSKKLTFSAVNCAHRGGAPGAADQVIVGDPAGIHGGPAAPHRGAVTVEPIRLCCPGVSSRRAPSGPRRRSRPRHRAENPDLRTVAPGQPQAVP